MVQTNDKDVEDVEENDMLLDMRDKTYMLYYICYGSEEYNLCYQEGKSLFPSLKVNHTALSRSGNFATPPNTTHPETIEIEDSDTEPDRKQKDRLIGTPLGDEPPKLPEKVAETSSQQPQEPILKCAVAAIPSAPSPIEALVPFP